MTRQKKLMLLPVGLMVLALGACTSAPPTHLTAFEDLVVGADIATNPKDGNIHATFGYERQTDAVVPKSQVPCASTALDETKNDTVKKDTNCIDAMSVLMNSHVQIDWFKQSVISQHFATGTPAVNIAKNPNLMEPFLSGKKVQINNDSHR